MRCVNPDTERWVLIHLICFKKMLYPFFYTDFPGVVFAKVELGTRREEKIYQLIYAT